MDTIRHGLCQRPDRRCTDRGRGISLESSYGWALESSVTCVVGVVGCWQEIMERDNLCYWLRGVKDFNNINLTNQ